MPAYLVGVYRHPSREAAERADRMCAPSHEAESADTEIHDTPPVVLAGHALAEALLGIEAKTVEEYRDRAHALVMNWKLEV
jgi:hypothetical protein